MDILGLISIIGTIVTIGSIVTTILIAKVDNNWQRVKDYYLSRYFKKVVDFTYENDDFAKDTIKYRFRNIIYDLNDIYEDAVIALQKTINRPLDKEFNRPLDFDAFYSGEFYIPTFNNLTTNPKDLELLKEFYDHLYENYGQKDNKHFLETAPFIDVEHAFYFYILDKLHDVPDEIKKYMQDDTKGIFDPYKLKKRSSIEKDIKRANRDKSRIIVCLNAIVRFMNDDFDAGRTKSDLIEEIIRWSLDSNSYDLSQLRGMGWHETRLMENDIKGAKGLLQYLYSLNRGTELTINYLVDNAGVEFFSDLVLGYALLNHPELHVKKINYHVNVLPIFVSDTIENDLEHTIKTVENAIKENIKEEDQNKFLSALSELNDMFDKEKSQAEIIPDFIWNMPTAYEDIARKKEIYMNSETLLIIKGDLNYRRLCRDKTWHFKTKLEEITKYINSPTLVIRSFKSDLVLDYTRTRFNENTQKDKDWRGKGKYGIITFMKKNG